MVSVRRMRGSGRELCIVVVLLMLCLFLGTMQMGRVRAVKQDNCVVEGQDDGVNMYQGTYL